MQNIEIANNLIQLCNKVYLIQVAYINGDISGMTDEIQNMEDILRNLSAEVYEEGTDKSNLVTSAVSNSPSCCGGSCSCNTAPSPRYSGIHPGFSAFASSTAQSPQTSTNGWIPVESSNIDAIQYNSDVEVLSIRFKGGGEYDYHGVSEGVYDDFMDAPSKGRYFYENIKNNYRWDRVL